MIKLSVVITAYNEEKKIKECLESVKDLADEIIVIDNDSADRTVEIAKKFTKHVYKQKNDPGNIDLQKNFGFEKASGEWILSLDADERVTEELSREIRETLLKNEPHPDPLLKGEGTHYAGYYIARKNIIFGKWIEHTGWYPDHQLRLFKKGKGKYVNAHYHEQMKLEGEAVYLQQNLLHHNYETIAQFLSKNLLVYGSNEAEELVRKGYTFDWRDSIRFPLKEFLSRYFARKGYKDGLHGLVLSLLMGFYHFVIFCYIWEKKGFVEVSEMKISEDLGTEIKQSEKDLQFWLSSKKIEEEKNIMKKTLLRVQRKFSVMENK